MKAESMSLCQLNLKIKSAIQAVFTDPVWVVAEISELRVNSSGHCYMELIEKDTGSDQILAKMKATIWSFTFRMLSPYFETATGYRLDAGLKVLISVLPEFHEVYGISLTVKDIDPTYTLGDLERKKQEILRKLQTDGVIDMNRSLSFPLVPQRVAVITSETAAGYGDFLDTLMHNSKGYYFYSELFAALVQGEKAAESIMNALDLIFEREDEFDLVVIIRGGGTQSDLECFNSYNLVYHITQFPLPVVTGIGHERDETIADIVANISVKTPTAVAELLIDKMTEFDDLLDEYKDQMLSEVTEIIDHEKQRVSQLSQYAAMQVKDQIHKESTRLISSDKRLGPVVRQYVVRKNDNLINYKYRISVNCITYFKAAQSKISISDLRMKRSTVHSFISMKDRLSSIEKNLEHLSPDRVLKRGYSISTSGGKIIKDGSMLKKGDELTTKFYKGGALSMIQKTTEQ